MIKSSKSLRSSLLLSLYFPLALFAFENNNTNKSNITMITMEQIPYGFYDPDGKPTGVLFDILKIIMKQSNIGNKNLLLPPIRIMHRMLAEPACTVVADTHEIVSNFDLVEPIGLEMKSGIIPRSGLIFADYASLANKRIAVPLGILFDQRFENDPSIIKEFPPKYLNAIRMLINGRVDGVAGSILALKYIAKREGVDAKKFGKPLALKINTMYLVCSKNLANEIKSKLKKTVKLLKQNGKIKHILEHYFGKNYLTNIKKKQNISLDSGLSP